MALVCESTSSHNKRAKITFRTHFMLRKGSGASLWSFCFSVLFNFMPVCFPTTVSRRSGYASCARLLLCICEEWRELAYKQISLALSRPLASTGYKLWLIFQLWFISQINKKQSREKMEEKKKKKVPRFLFSSRWTVMYAACEQHEKLTFLAPNKRVERNRRVN